MNDDIHLISDDNGLAIIGEPAAVERFLRSAGLWAASKDLGLHRINPLLDQASNAIRTVSEIAANSGRWIKLTEESAQLVKEHGLMESKVSGVSHVLIGTPGKVQNWLQADTQWGSILTNPAMLSGIAGIMAQVSGQQATADITAYLARIDVKLDDVLRKQNDAVVAQMIGAGAVIREATTVREVTGTVNEVSWGKVEGTSETIESTRTYALLQIKAIADKLEATTKVREIAAIAKDAKVQVREWLAVLARCSELQGLLDVLELERVLAVSPRELDTYRVGLQAARRDGVTLIAQYTELLLDRIDAACATANAKMMWNFDNSHLVLNSGNSVAAGVDEFHVLLGIAATPRSWDSRRLDGTARAGALAIQKSKEKAPAAAAAASALTFAGAVWKFKVGGRGSSS